MICTSAKDRFIVSESCVQNLCKSVYGTLQVRRDNQFCFNIKSEVQTKYQYHNTTI